MNTIWKKAQKSYQKNRNTIAISLLFSYLFISIFSNGYIPDYASQSLVFFNIVRAFIRYGTYICLGIVCLGDILLGLTAWPIMFLYLMNIYIFLITGSVEIIVFTVALGVSIHLEFSNILKIYKISCFLGLLSVLIFVCLGVFTKYITDLERVRTTLGFQWVTVAPLFFMYWLFSVFNTSKKIDRAQLLLFFFIVLLLCAATNSRMALIGSLLAIIIYIYKEPIISKMKDNCSRKRFEMLICILPFFILVLSFMLPLAYAMQFPLMDKVDSLLSNRLQLAWQALSEHGLPIFGQKIQWIGYGDSTTFGIYNFVDNSYVKLAVNYGVVFIVLLSGSLSYTIYVLIKKENYLTVLYLCLAMLISFVECQLINPIYNIYILSVGVVFNRLNQLWNIKVRRLK